MAEDEVIADHSSMKKTKSKKKKSRESTGEDGEIDARKRENMGEDVVTKKKSKKKNKEKKVDSEPEDDGMKKIKETKVDSEAEDGVKKSKKKLKKIKVESEADGDEKKKKKKKKKKKTGNSESSKVCEGSEGNQRDDKRKRKREDCDLGAEENTDKSHKEMERKTKKMKPSVDSKVEETSLSSTKEDAKKKKIQSVKEKNNKNSTKDAANKEKKKKKKKQSEDSEAEEASLSSTKDWKKKSQEKKPSEDSEVEENNSDSTKDAGNKEKKKMKKKKQSENSEAEETSLSSTKDAKKKSKEKKPNSEVEENNKDSTKDAANKEKKKKKKQSDDSEAEATKKRKKKQKCSKSDKDVTTPSSKSSKKVKFSDQVEVFPAEDEERGEEEEEEEEEEVGLVRGKRFTKEEDALIKKSVLEYIDNHALGDEGLNMVLQCQSHPQVRGCWKEISAALPWRPYTSVYYRAHTVFEEKSKGIWTKEDLELVKEFQKKHGNDWKTLADAMGKHRVHVKDTWRRIRLASNKGHWSREEYQSLFDLVNSELRMKAYKEKHSKHGMLRDNIPWMAISDQLGTRDHVFCCTKWYDQLTSPMVAKGTWANVDDYTLLEELMKLDAACIDDVDWDNLLENRDGEACRKRWNQMVLHIGTPGTKTFAEEVEILSDRYCPDLAEDRENFDNRPYDPED